MSASPLPVDARLPEIVETIRQRRAAIITAPPGAGKTTRVPPALTVLGTVGVLQPRRVAARALARRVAEERGWTLGREVGWHVRNDRLYARDTRVLFMTEGILSARLQSDPLAERFGVIVLDEFHERTIHADLALAMACEAWRARSDLSLVIMSATLDASRVAAFLDDAPVITIGGRTFPLDVSYEPGGDAAGVAAREIARGAPAVLCFLPGAREIRQVVDALGPASRQAGFDVLPLHGGLPPDEQDRAIAPGRRPRVIAATNIAETSLTVPDVTAVVDAGLQRLSRFDAARGIDVLVTERITRDAADQRAGRAGRVAAGRAVRLWDPRDRLRPHREPEIGRVDLAPAVLAVLAWGGDPRRLAWLDPPRPDALDAAFGLLQRLGAVDGEARITPLGDNMRALPLHPRLARILIDAGGAFEAAAACAILSEAQRPAVRRAEATVTSDCDLLPLIDAWRDMPPQVRRAAEEFMHAAGGPGRRIGETALRHALFTGFADRAARRREPRGRSLLLASGSGATLAAESGVIESEFLACLDVSTAAGDPIVRLASAIDKAWLAPNRHDVEHVLTADGGVRATRTDYLDALPLSSRAVAVDPLAAAPLLAEAWLARAAGDPAAMLLRQRLAFAGIPADLQELALTAAARARRVGEIDLERALPHTDRAALDARAPASLRLPSGRQVMLDYRADGSIVAAAKLQELFGLTETPRVMNTLVTFELLAPNGRPVQITQDLASFWRRGYPEVRRELRARYPRHPWPEDPLSAAPTARPKPRTR
ncbi:MAG TPA: ATP-dependent helicase C-terminal domain-containing protein [Vicinamibacterales bacterium]|nr:ATP-dependent helicase C-terminal domain-containing protein [Vicinamibacterales bacterium]